MASNPLGISDQELQSVGKANTINGVLQDFGNMLQDDLRKSLQQKIRTITPKSLEQSIVFDIKFTGSEYRFQLLMNDYGKFIDEGVQGAGGVKKDGSVYLKKNSTSRFKYTRKKPPLSELTKWSNNQGVNPYVVQNSVYHKGIKQTNFYSDVVTQDKFDQLYKDLADAGAKQVALSITNSFINGTVN